MKKKPEQIKRLLRGLMPMLILAAGSAVVLLTGHGIECPIHEYTGLYCPLCGASRMALALMHMDVASAFRAHAVLLVLLPVFLFLYGASLASYVRTGRYSLQKNQRILLLICVFALFFTGILRNVTIFSVLAPH